MTPRLYLAGPMVFLRDPDPVFARMKAICREVGAEGVAPLDGQIGLEGAGQGRTVLERIVAADIGLMERLDAGLFCLDPFRIGVEMDAGTAFEVGFMVARGKPVAGWTSDPRDYPAKVSDLLARLGRPAPARAGANESGGMSGSLRDAEGWLLHSEGCVQNAMIHIGIERGGGLVAADPDWEVAFRRAAAALVSRFAGRGKEGSGE